MGAGDRLESPDRTRRALEEAVASALRTGTALIYVILDDFDHVVQKAPTAVLNSLRSCGTTTVPGHVRHGHSRDWHSSVTKMNIRTCMSWYLPQLFPLDLRRGRRQPDDRPVISPLEFASKAQRDRTATVTRSLGSPCWFIERDSSSHTARRAHSPYIS